MLKTVASITHCLKQAAQCDRRSIASSDDHAREIYSRMAENWRLLSETHKGIANLDKIEEECGRQLIGMQSSIIDSAKFIHPRKPEHLGAFSPNFAHRSLRLGEHGEMKGLDMKQDEQERVDMVLSEIQCILAELPLIQKTRVEQTNASAMVVSEFHDLKAERRVESAIPLTTHRIQNNQNDSPTSDATFAQEIEALLGIPLGTLRTNPPVLLH